MSHQNPRKQEHKASTGNERRSFRLGHFAVPLAAALFLATASAADPTTTNNNKEPSEGACCGGTIENCDCSGGTTQQKHQERPNYATGRKNPECPPDRPIRLTDDNHSCVPCIAYTEHPGEPDWGCSSDEPLCIIDDQQQQRANPGQAGHLCAPYPCHNTKPAGVLAMDTAATAKTQNMALGIVMDEGCTPSTPICVDALGSDPPPGGPGMMCVEATTTTRHDDDTTNQGNVAFSKRRSAWGRPAFGVLDKSHSNKNAAASSFDLVSLCTGCPLSGQGRSCESTKACDSLGGVVQSNVPSW